MTLADPTRRSIVEALTDGEHAVNDLVRTVAIRQSGVSRHLRILHDAGFVTVRSVGQRRLYALRPEPFRDLDRWVGRYRRLWAVRLDRLADVAVRQPKGRVTNPKPR